MSREFSQAELEAYLDEQLDYERSAEVEKALRESPDLHRRLADINSRRDSGVHSLGDIWRRHQLGVPNRETLGSYLLGVLDDDHAAYIRFRVDVLKCPYTIANLRDLTEQEAAEAEQRDTRKQRFLNSTHKFFSDRKPKGKP
ncbi:MAG TPA: hypothetical protein DCQ98_03810 [Planctomycetaceae bacterium]|nr:hypothetical protein [Planctomycetaceae bacterium]HRE99613.1 hypothetical protein [Pirellulaceae bacterium]